MLLFCIQILILNFQSKTTAQEFIYEGRLTSTDGLSQSIINCIIQDSRGFLWIGTQDGLNRYDGNNFVIYQNIPGDTSSLSNNYILSLCEDKKGNIWAGTMSGGLNRLNPKTGKFRVFKHDPDDPGSISDNKIWALTADENNSIYTGTSKGLNVLNNDSGTFKKFTHAENDSSTIPSNIVLSLYSRNNIILIGTNRGLSVYDRNNKNIKQIRIQNKPSGTKNFIIWSISYDHSDNFILGTNSEIWKYNNSSGSLIQVKSIDNLDDQTIWTVLPVGKNQIWAGTRTGIAIFDRKSNKLSSVEVYDNSSIGNTWSILQDRSGLIWAGTDNGLLKFVTRETDFGLLDADPDNPVHLSNPRVNTILVDRNRDLWVGTDGGGLNRFNQDASNFKYYRSDVNGKSSVSSDFIWSLLEDRDGMIWIGTYGKGIDVFNPFTQEFTNFKTYESNPNTLSNNRILTLLEDDNGDIWIGTRGGGLNRYDKSTGMFEVYRHDPEDNRSISSNTILSLAKDKNGTLWIGTFEGGLCKFEQETDNFICYKNQTGNAASLSNNNVWTIMFDSKNRLWTGTQGGLNIVNEPGKKIEFIHLTTKQGLPGNVIFGLAEDKNGNIWMSTFKGIAMLNVSLFDHLSDPYEYINDPVKPLIKCYDVHDGLQGNEFNQGAWFQSESGTIYFGGSNGLTYFNPDSIRPDTFSPSVVLTGFRIFNKETMILPDNMPEGSTKDKVILEDKQYYLPGDISYLDNIIITHRERVFSFSFASLDFRNPSEIQYAYFMEGFEDNWNFVGNRNEATYTNLSPGSYIFKVKGTNKGGRWSENESHIGITILPPFWKTTWFILVVIVLVALTILLIIRRIIIVHKRKVLEEKEKMELQLKTIKNQIDPHFAFNAINMISSIIYKSDPDTVYDHFSKLAHLIRKTLQDSAKVSRPLDEEIDFVKKYVEIQQARFKNKFDFQLHVEEDTDMNIEVPKMIIQTYVENSIKHGLIHQQEKGKLEIIVKPFNNGLQITVEDNGIGWQKAKELSRNSSGMGLKIVRQIFSMYNKMFKYNIKQEIINLRDKQGNPSGTKVLVTISR